MPLMIVKFWLMNIRRSEGENNVPPHTWARVAATTPSQDASLLEEIEQRLIRVVRF